jgi:tetratricopeptide (TPR) repeat protein
MVRVFSIAFVVATLATTVWAQSPSAGSIETALRSRQYEQALSLIERQLAASPNDAKLLTFKGIALSRTGKKAEALSAYNKALAASPNNLAALEGAAELEYEAKTPRATQLLQKILALQPSNKTSHAMLAVMAYQKHDCPTAVHHFQQSWTLINQQTMALGAYGSCLMQMERATDAVPVLRSIAALSPGDPHASYNIAVAQLAAKEPKDAIETLKPLIELPTAEADVLDLASVAYENVGDTPRAVELLRKAILASPTSARYYLDFATISFNHNSFQVGIDVLNAGLAHIPDSADLYVARGVLYIQLGRYDKGGEDFEAARKINPTQASISLAEGLAQMQASKLDEALKTVNAQLQTHPNDAFLHYLRAEVLSRDGAAPESESFQKALQSATQAVQLKPDFTLARNVLGNLYLKSGQIENAIKQSRETLQYEPANEVALYHLLQCLRRIKDPKGEIPEVNKKLAAAREATKQKQASENRYRLYEPTAQ